MLKEKVGFREILYLGVQNGAGSDHLEIKDQDQRGSYRCRVITGPGPGPGPEPGSGPGKGKFHA